MFGDARFFMPRAQRFTLQLPLFYQKPGRRHWREGRTVNISRTGILFSTDDALQPDSSLRIRVNFPTNATLTCRGAIVRPGESAFAVRIDHSRFKKAAS